MKKVQMSTLEICEYKVFMKKYRFGFLERSAYKPSKRPESLMQLCPISKLLTWIRAFCPFCLEASVISSLCLAICLVFS